MPDVLTVLHPAAHFSTPEEIPPSRADWRRVREYLAGEWPRPIPNGLIWNGLDDQDRAAIATWRRKALADPYVVVDTEYYPCNAPAVPPLTLLGLYAPGAGCLQIPWLEGQHYVLRDRERDEARQWVQALVLDYAGQWVAHNWPADWPVLQRNLGVEVPWDQLDDTMLMHAVLHCELAHDLGTLTRQYSPYGAHKLLWDQDRYAYNRGDLVATAAAYEAMCA